MILDTKYERKLFYDGTDLFYGGNSVLKKKTYFGKILRFKNTLKSFRVKKFARSEHIFANNDLQISMKISTTVK